MVDEAQKKQAAQWVARGVAALKTKDLKLARQSLLQARKLDPENVDALLWLTRTTRDPEKRRAILRQVLKIDPQHAQARRALAKLDQSPAASESQVAESGFEMPRFVEDDEPITGLRARAQAVQPPSLPEVPPAVSPVDEEPAPVEASAPESETLTTPADEPALAESLSPPVEAGEMPVDSVSTDDQPQPESEPTAADIAAFMPPTLAADEPALEEPADEAEPPIVPAAPLDPPVALQSPQPVEAPAAEAPGTEPAAASAETDAVDDLLAELALPATAELAPVPAAPTEARAEVKRCPQCNSAMTLNEQTGEYYCVYCGYGMPGDTALAVAASSLYPETPWPSAQRARHCLTCDSISLIPAGQDGDSMPCPVCQQAVLELEEATLSLPDSYLPFKVNEAEAAIAIEDASSGGLRRLFGGGKRDMSAPRPLFIPVWLFTGVGYLEYDFPGFEGQGGIYTETYKLLPVHGLPQLDGRLLRLASNVDLENAERFTAEVGREVSILLPNVSLQSALHDARGLMLNDTRQKARQRIAPPTPTSREGDKNMLTRGDAFVGAAIASASRGDIPMTTVKSEVQEMVYQLALLPVWINEVRDGNRMSMGLVNGFTGQAALGELVRRRRR